MRCGASSSASRPSRLTRMEKVPNPEDLPTHGEARAFQETSEGTSVRFGLWTGDQKEAPRAAARVGVSGMLRCEGQDSLCEMARGLCAQHNHLVAPLLPRRCRHGA